MLSREPATGGSRFARRVVPACVVVMTVAAFSALDGGSGPVPTSRQR